MKKFKLLIALFAVSLFIPSAAYAWGGAAGDGKNYGQLQETAVVYNNSGSALTSGTVVVWDSTATAGSTLGAYVTTTSTADVIYAAGVVRDSSIAAGSSGVIVTRGPVQALIAGSSDGSISAMGAIGTANGVAGQVGSGTNLGFALQTSQSTNYHLMWIWVNPTNGD